MTTKVDAVANLGLAGALVNDRSWDWGRPEIERVGDDMVVMKGGVGVPMTVELGQPVLG